MVSRWFVVAALFSVAVGVVVVPAVSRAAPIAIANSPQETSGPFRHNVFHSITNSTGTSGAVLGWFELDTSQTNFYDSNTGEFLAHFNIFDQSVLSTNIGAVTAAGFLPASGFNTFSGSILGAINWQINLSPSNFLTYMQNNFGNLPSYNVMMTYLDVDYVTSSNGHNANTWSNGIMTLWGADNFDGMEFSSARLGTDMVVTMVPLPAAMWLLGSGLLVFVGVARRHK